MTFTYVDDKTPVIEVIQKVTNEKLPEDTPSASNPKTGDDTNLWIPALCLILSAGGLIGMSVASRRKKKKGADRLKQLYLRMEATWIWTRWHIGAQRRRW